MKTVEDRVRAKRNEIEIQRSVIVHKMQELESLKSRLAMLEEQMAMLDSLLTDDISDDVTAVSPTRYGSNAAPHVPDLRPSPTDGVRQLLSTRPDGMSQAEIVAALAGRVATTSANPRAILRNTIHNMLTRDLLVRTDSGLIRIQGTQGTGTEPSSKE